MYSWADERDVETDGNILRLEWQARRCLRAAMGRHDRDAVL